MKIILVWAKSIPSTLSVVLSIIFVLPFQLLFNGFWVTLLLLIVATQIVVKTGILGSGFMSLLVYFLITVVALYFILEGLRKIQNWNWWRKGI